MVLKLFKDTFLIASALALVLFLLFLTNTLTNFSAEKPTDMLSGDAIVNQASYAVGTTGLKMFFFAGIVFMLYLIYKAWNLPGPYKSLPRPSGINSVPRPGRLTAPRPLQPVVREVARPMRQAYREIVRTERDLEKDLHDELTYIRKLLGEGKHERARIRYRGINR